MEAGQSPRIEAFLPYSPERLATLVELIHMELGRRLRARQPARLEKYLGRFPVRYEVDFVREHVLQPDGQDPKGNLGAFHSRGGHDQPAHHRADQRNSGNNPKAYVNPSLLLLDELGYLPIDKRGVDLMFRIVAARYESGWIVLTTNRAFAG